MRFIRNTLRFIRHSWIFFNLVKSAKRIGQAKLTRHPFLNAAETAEEIKEKAGDYPFEAVFCALMLLRGQRIPADSGLGHRLAHASMMIGITDYLYDQGDTPRATIRTLVFDPEYLTDNRIETLLQYYSQSTFALLKNEQRSFFEKYIDEGLDVEDDNRLLQLGSELEKTLNITLRKGGVSVLLYASLLPVPLTAELIALCRSLGGIIQLLDDIFDLSKDLSENLNTSATIQQNAVAMHNQLLTFGEKSLDEILSLDLKRFDVEFLHYLWYMFLQAGLSHTKHLADIEKTSGKSFKTFTSASLIFNRRSSRALIAVYYRSLHYPKLPDPLNLSAIN